MKPLDMYIGIVNRISEPCRTAKEKSKYSLAEQNNNSIRLNYELP